jgi:uncharacterized protein (TIGR02118 family)
MKATQAWRLERQGVRLVFVYRLKPGVDPDDFERWLYDTHIPDLLENPFIKRLVLNRVLAGPDGEAPRYYRTAEQHFDDEQSYLNAQEWRRAHPVPVERSAGPLIEVDFRVICAGEEVDCEAARLAVMAERR